MNSIPALYGSRRQELQAALSDTVFDLVVIGGGITGTGVARDAAMRVLKVALIEAQDLASGTSSRSSKMIHGGLRYLVQGDIPVVKESASERARLAKIAPHLATKSDYIIAIHSWKERWALRIALSIYEWLGKVAKSDHHQFWSLQQLQQREPGLNVEGVSGAIVYPEYLTDDARLTLATARSATQHNAVIATYCKVTALSKNGSAFQLDCQAQLPDEDWSCQVQARSVVNCAGPWVDQICQLESTEAPKRLALSRGVHLVVDHQRLPVNHTVVMSTPDKRKIFAVPLGNYTYLGTTDEFYPDSDYWPPVNHADVTYLLATTNQNFPSAKLDADDIVSVWSGVRPLVGSTDSKATEISRKDEMWFGPLDVLTVGGGKLSAYRAMAERIVDKLSMHWSFTTSSCTTHEHPLPGGGPLTTEPQSPDAVTDARWRKLYGSESSAVAEQGDGLVAEVRFAVLYEGALRLEDYWARRSSRAWFDTNAGLDSLAEAAAVMADLLAWSEERTTLEINRCIDIDRDSKSNLKL